MKYIILLITITLFSACENNSNNLEEIVQLKVNHYKQTAIGADRTLVLMVQENENIGSNEWTYIYGGIDGFNYEFGFEYELKLIKRKVTNPPADGSSIKYELLETISKLPTKDENPFRLTLKSSSMFNPPSFIFGNIQNGFTLLDEITIDCNNICDDFSNALNDEDEIKGLFTHINPNTIKLESIIIE